MIALATQVAIPAARPAPHDAPIVDGTGIRRRRGVVAPARRQVAPGAPRVHGTAAPAAPMAPATPPALAEVAG
jgi:hypothetical protein